MSEERMYDDSGNSVKYSACGSLKNERLAFEGDSNLVGNYEIEKHVFRTCRYQYIGVTDRDGETNGTGDDDDDGLIKVDMKAATSTRGRQLIIPHHDATGIMIWPASHLLCQYLSYCLSQTTQDETFKLGNTILELGCGTGISGIVAAVAVADRMRHSMTKVKRCNHSCLTSASIDSTDTGTHNTTTVPETTIVLTDMEPGVIELCRQNIHRNQHQINPKTHVFAATLQWGDVDTMAQIIEYCATTTQKFDTVIGADIVYPDTSELALSFMFQTVEGSLRQGGNFLLSFAARDGHRTPCKLIDAANNACFRIGLIRTSTFIPTLWDGDSFLPPTLDAILLYMTRDVDASEHNDSLGGDDCVVFPGLRRAIKLAENKADGGGSSDEEWQSPPYFSDSGDDDD